MSAIVWLGRDLRLTDQPALRAALESHEVVVPAFCLDDRLLHGRHASGPRAQFLLEALSDLDRSLRERRSGLVIRRGPPERELPALAKEIGADEVHYSADVGPFARRRAAAVRRALASVDVVAHPGVTVVDVRSISTHAGKPYTIFSPFHRAWETAERREPLEAPADLPPLPVRKGRIPSLASLRLEQEVLDPPAGGETAGRRRMARFLSEDVSDYASGNLSNDRSSRLSAYLHFGCVSARELEARLPAGEGPAAFRRQLAWRDFHHHVLLHHPRNARSEFQQRFRGAIRWSRAERAFDAWCEGRTGYPLVDAAMRQLRAEGWMHNRARLVAGSFLTKDLGIDWRWGERFFMRLLVDGDEANNNGNWQWIASVGTDPQPAFRRILNPARQMQAHDPDGSYVRRHVAELEHVPDEYLREPWTMPADVQRSSRCVIGRDYPAPIVDHALARREALERYRL